MKGLAVVAVGVVALFGLVVGGGSVVSLPAANDEQLAMYQAITAERRLQIDWGALIAVDAVRFQQDFSRVNRFTVEQTADLFAMCEIFAPWDFRVLRAKLLELGYSLGVLRPARVTFSLSEIRGDVTAELVDEAGQAYASGSVLPPGRYTVQVRASTEDDSFRLQLSLDTERCGPEEVGLVMDRLGLVGDDRQMVLHMMTMLQAGTTAPVEILPGGSYAWPLDAGYPITSGFGGRWDPVSGGWSYHTGIDIGAPLGTPVYAASDGIVAFTGWDGNYGQAIWVLHQNPNVMTVYAHLDASLVVHGQPVSRGQVIGQVGSTGKSTGPHLHFEWREGGVAIDPLSMYGAAPSTPEQ